MIEKSEHIKCSRGQSPLQHELLIVDNVYCKFIDLTANYDINWKPVRSTK